MITGRERRGADEDEDRREPVEDLLGALHQVHREDREVRQADSRLRRVLDRRQDHAHQEGEHGRAGEFFAVTTTATATSIAAAVTTPAPALDLVETKKVMADMLKH